MNFAKHRVSEREMLSEMMRYCNKIITHRRQKDERYLKIQACISTRTGGVEIITNREDSLILAIRYNERNDFYYFLEKECYGARVLENRITINCKGEFYAYFNEKIDEHLAHEELSINKSLQ